MFRAVSAGVADAVLLVGSDDCIAAWNDAVRRMFGFAGRPEARHWQTLFAADAQTRLAAGAGHAVQLTALHSGGEGFAASVSITPLSSGGAVWVVRNLEVHQEERRVLELAYGQLERAHHEWVAAFDAVRDPIFLHDAEGRILNANRAYAERAGEPITTLRGRRYWEVLPRGDGPLPSCLHAGGHPADRAADEVEIDGAVYLSHAFVAGDPKGGHRCSMHILEDITEQRRAESGLRAREARLQAIFEAARDVSFIVTDPNGGDPRIVEFSPGAEHLFGYRREEAVGQPVAMLYRPEEVARFPEVIEALRQQREGFSGEAVLQRKDGKDFHALFTTYPIRDERNRMTATLWVALDISGLRRTEEALRRSEQRLAQAQQIAGLGHCEWDVESGTLSWSDEVYRLFGGAPGEFEPTHENYLSRIHPDDRHLLARGCKTVSSKGDGYSVEYRVLQPDGSLRWIHEQAELLGADDAGDQRVFGTLLDITERMESQERIAALGRLYAVLSEANKAIVRIPEREQLLEAICRIVVEEGRLRMAWIGLLDPQRQVLYPAVSYGHVAGYLDDFTIALTDEAQSSGPSAQSLLNRGHTVCHDIAGDPRMAPWREGALARGYRTSAAFGFSDRHNVHGALAVYSEQPGFFTPEVVRLFAGLADDISFALEALTNRQEREQAEAELREFNETLEARILARTNELTALNRELEAFSYSVSHDLRAPLRSLDGFANLLSQRYADLLDETGQDYLRRIRAASTRMSELIDDLLELSRVTCAPLTATRIDLGALAVKILDELAVAEPQRRVRVQIDEPVTACCDTALVRVLLENLLGNAWKFTGRTEDPCIELYAERSGGETVYCVRDNGVGFEMAYAGRLFGAFQRLHAADEFPGSGIGLATAYRIVQRHGGRIWADSAPGAGATFRFTLAPRLGAGAESEDEGGETAAAAG